MQFSDRYRLNIKNLTIARENHAADFFQNFMFSERIAKQAKAIMSG